MEHVIDVRVRLHIDEAECRAGETPRDAAERLVRTNLMLSDAEEIRATDELR
jgi:hypothetical protein